MKVPAGHRRRVGARAGGYLGWGVSRMQLWGDRRRGGEWGVGWRRCWLARPVAGGVAQHNGGTGPSGPFCTGRFPQTSLRLRSDPARPLCRNLLSARAKWQRRTEWKQPSLQGWHLLPAVLSDTKITCQWTSSPRVRGPNASPYVMCSVRARAVSLRASSEALSSNTSILWEMLNSLG